MCWAQDQGSVERTPYIEAYNPDIHVGGHRPVASLRSSRPAGKRGDPWVSLPLSLKREAAAPKSQPSSPVSKTKKEGPLGFKSTPLLRRERRGPPC